MPPEDRVEHTMLAAVAAQLTRSSTAALEASHELLAHYADTGGSVPTQRTVDSLVDNAADALLALTDSLAEASRLVTAASEPASASPSVEVGLPPSARTARSRGRVR